MRFFEMELPKQEGLREIQASVKKHGRIKTFFDQVQRNWLTIIMLFVYILYDQGALKILSSDQSQILSLSNTNTQNTEINFEDGGAEISSPVDKLEEETTSFNPNDWYIESFELDNEGFYCSLTKKFDYWSVWSKTSYEPDIKTVKVKYLVKQKKNSKEPPTIVVSYGEFKPNFSPIQFYRLNIFDTDLTSIRLYDSNEDSKVQDWLDEEPDLSSEMLLTLSPRSINPNSRTVNLNPSLTYALSGRERPQTYQPNNINFEIVLPTVGIEENTRKQIGIGSSKEACFKLISVEIVQ